MMTRGQILDGVRAIVGAEAGIEDLTLIGPASRLSHEMKTDTLCLLNVWAAIEKRFGISFTMVELLVHGNRDSLTVADLVDAVAGKLSHLQPHEVAA